MRTSGHWLLAGLLCCLPIVSAGERVVVTDRALEIHKNSLVIDGHNDLPWELRKFGSSFDEVDISKATALHTDIPRLRKGGLGAQFWAAYVPSRTMVTGGAARDTLEQIDLIHRMVRRYPETFAFAWSANDIERIHGSGKIACLIGVEGGHSIENSLALLRIYHQLGVRYMTLTHSDSVGWADAATGPGQNEGLNDFGKSVVHEMNKLGMLVDISHVSVKTMHATLDASKAPVIASHSSAYGVAQHPRNIPDDVLRRLKENGGVVMLNFYSGFIVPEAARITTNMFEVQRELRAQFPKDEDYRKAMDDWRKANPVPRGTVHDLLAHLQHVVKVAGIDHVGLGSDYDGISTLPEQLEDVSSYPVITQGMLDLGFSESDIKKVLGQNILRALREAERVAASLRPSPAKD